MILASYFEDYNFSLETMLRLFTLASIVLLKIQLTVSQNDCWSAGACLQSVMIDQAPSKDPLSCENFCKNIAECVWFTYYEDNGVCTAMTECINFSHEIPRTISGNAKCNGNLECNINGRYTGVLIGVGSAQSPQNCQNICQSDQNCNCYTHDSISNVCYQFSDCVAINENCLTCISGEANCPQETGLSYQYFARDLHLSEDFCLQ